MLIVKCPDCLGHGTEICSNPDHGFLRVMGSMGQSANESACPCCSHDEHHRIPNTVCYNCNGSGKVTEAEFFSFFQENHEDYTVDEFEEIKEYCYG